MKWQNARKKSDGTWMLTGSEGLRRATDAEMGKLAEENQLGPRALAAWQGRASGGPAPSAPPAPPSPGTPPAPPASGAPNAEPGSYASAAQAWSEAVETALRDFEAEDRASEPGAEASEADGSLAAAMRRELRAQGATPRDEEPPPAA